MRWSNTYLLCEPLEYISLLVSTLLSHFLFHFNIIMGSALNPGYYSEVIGTVMDE